MSRSGECMPRTESALEAAAHAYHEGDAARAAELREPIKLKANALPTDGAA